MYIKYQVSPKLIDDSGNEQPLTDFVINTSYDKKASSGTQLTLENAEKYVSLDLPNSVKSFELQSDEPITLAFYSANGATNLLELTEVSNQIIKCEGFTNRIKIKNVSGSVANILYRAFE
jgi:hypothetical protein